STHVSARIAAWSIRCARESRRFHPRACFSTAHGNQSVGLGALSLGSREKHLDADRREPSGPYVVIAETWPLRRDFHRSLTPSGHFKMPPSRICATVEVAPDSQPTRGRDARRPDCVHTSIRCPTFKGYRSLRRRLLGSGRRGAPFAAIPRKQNLRR